MRPRDHEADQTSYGDDARAARLQTLSTREIVLAATATLTALAAPIGPAWAWLCVSLASIAALVVSRRMQRQHQRPGICSECRHPWSEHQASGNDRDGVCSECVYELEHGQRDRAAVLCRSTCPPID